MEGARITSCFFWLMNAKSIYHSNLQSMANGYPRYEFRQGKMNDDIWGGGSKLRIFFFGLQTLFEVFISIMFFFFVVNFLYLDHAAGGATNGGKERVGHSQQIRGKIESSCIEVWCDNKRKRHALCY